MLNTFQNYRRHKLRQDERELHLRTIEALSTRMPDDNDEPSAICSMAEGILRDPSDDRERSFFSLFKAHRKRVLFVILTFVAPIIALYVSLSRRHVPSGVTTMDSRRDRLVSMIQDWNITQLERLENHKNPQSRALEWILTMDIAWDRVDVLKEKFALATLFFATQASNGDMSWTNHDGWLSFEATCSWYGVTCNGRSGVVRRLDLSMNGLQSSIPAEVALLNLESLALYSNDLIGTIPNELYRMTDLGK